MVDRVRFSRAGVMGRECEYITEVLTQGRVAGDGVFSKKCHQVLERYLDVLRVLLTTSCTDALEMSALLMNLVPGDEVIVPSFTFVSTANAFVMRGAQPVFVDIRPDTLNMDEKLIEKVINSRTKALVLVHYAGVGCEMDTIMAIADHYQVPVIEDNAHGLFGKYRGRFLGTFGKMSTLSFHETKNITCGEGGALILNDAELVERAEIIWDKGTDRSRFLRGQVDKYSWVDLGSSFLPSELNAAMLYGQLEVAEKIQQKRKKIWNHYRDQLQDWALSKDIRLPFVPDTCEQAFHMFYLILPSLEKRQKLIAFLEQHHIEAVFHYSPLHYSSMGLQFLRGQMVCPVTERISDCLLRLPFYTDLTETDQDRVISVLLKWK